jgi:hypothetical protein
MSNKIFEEAIADAKKLREVAEANAKKAVLEAVTPRIREFIESELLESQEDSKNEMDQEVEEGDQGDDLDEITLDESALRKLSTLLGLDMSKELSSKKNAKIVSEATNKAFKSLSATQKRELNAIANKINQTKRNLTSKSIDSKETILKENSKMRQKYYEVDLKALREEVEKELAETMDDAEVEEGDDYNEGDSLEAMLQELKLVLDLGDDIEKEKIPEDLRGMVEEDEDSEEPDEELELSDDDPEGDEESEGDEGGEGEIDFQAMMDDEGEKKDEMVEVDEEMLAEEILRIRKLVRESKSGKVDHHFGGKGGAAGVDGAFGGKGKTNAGVKKAFGGGDEGKDVFTNPPTMNKLAEAFRDERRKNRALDEKLKKYRSAVESLREQLEDLNLFNAKLLYVNKLLQNKNLNEAEKKSVIKALDEAKSLNEAKSLFKSLTETFARGNAKTLTESRNRGSSSRTTTSSAPKQGNAPELDRWQRLAGLK